MSVKLPSGIRAADGPLRFVASSNEHGHSIISIRIIGGGDKLRMLRAANSVREQCEAPVLMPLVVRSRMVARDNHRLYTVDMDQFRLSMLVDNLLFDSNGYWCLYGNIVDHDRICAGLSLRQLECCAEYNPSYRLGRLRINLPQTDAAA